MQSWTIVSVAKNGRKILEFVWRAYICIMIYTTSRWGRLVYIWITCTQILTGIRIPTFVFFLLNDKNRKIWSPEAVWDRLYLRSLPILCGLFWPERTLNCCIAVQPSLLNFCLWKMLRIFILSRFVTFLKKSKRLTLIPLRLHMQRFGIFQKWNSEVILYYLESTRLYSWIGRPIRVDKKIIPEKTVRATTIPRPPLESSRRGESRSAWSIFVKFIFDLFYKITFQIMPKQK